MQLVRAAAPMLVIAALVYGVLRFLVGLPDDFVSGIASIPLLAISGIYERLERKEVRTRIRAEAARPVPPPERFGLSWPILLSVGTLMMGATAQVGGFVAGFFFGIALGAAGGEPLETPGFFFYGAVAAIPLIAILVYWVGRWLGARSCRPWRDAGLCVLSLILGKIAGIGLDLVLLGEGALVEWRR